ncbi:MAG: LON peptidase substrate-binding domain-containing protein [Vicinamibacterales bacterium]
MRDTVLFPNSFMPLAVARESSVRLIDDAIAQRKADRGVHAARRRSRGACTGRPVSPSAPPRTSTRCSSCPTAACVSSSRGWRRLTLDEVVATQPYLRARVARCHEDANDDDRLEIDALARNIKANFQQVVSLSPLLSDDLQTLATNITEPGRLADFIASSLTTISTAVKQEVLETLDSAHAWTSLNRILIKELEVLELGSKIQSQVQSEVGKNQREYFLREQMKAIQKELGEGDDQTEGDRGARREDRSRRHARACEEGSAARTGSSVEDAAGGGRIHVSRTYVDWLVALPWATPDRGSDRSAAGPRASSTPITPDSRKRRTAFSSISPCAS